VGRVAAAHRSQAAATPRVARLSGTCHAAFGGRGVDADIGADLSPCSEVLEQMLGMSAHSGNQVAADLQPQRCVVRSQR
jgi:hypothetical protein